MNFGITDIFWVSIIVTMLFLFNRLSTRHKLKLRRIAQKNVDLAMRTPMMIWCQLHRNRSDYLAVVLIHRDGTLVAPPSEASRILRRIEHNDVTPRLGAPSWTEKETRYVSGLEGASMHFVEMLGHTYFFPD